MSAATPLTSERLRLIGQACVSLADELRDGEAPIESAGRTATIDDAQLTLLVDRMLRLRRERERLFGDALFADPVWDMLLDLFACYARGQRVSVSSLCIAAAVPSTTALRYLSLLEARGLVTSSRATDDCRKRYVELTPGAYQSLQSLLSKFASSV